MADVVVIGAGISGNAEELGRDTHYRRLGNLRCARAPAEAEVIKRLVIEQAATGLDTACCPPTRTCVRSHRQEFNGRFRVTSDLQTWHGRMTETAAVTKTKPHVFPTTSCMAEVITLFGEVVPAFKEAQIEDSWAGLLDMTRDAVPSYEGVMVAMSFSGHGFCLGPITGRIVSCLVQGEAADLPVEAFGIGRFPARTCAAEPPMLHG